MEYNIPSGQGRGVQPATGLPSPLSQHGVKEKGPVAGVKGWMDTGPGSLLIPAPSRGAQNRMQAEGGAGSQPHHSSQRIPTPPPGLCPRQGTELQRS